MSVFDDCGSAYDGGLFDMGPDAHQEPVKAPAPPRRVQPTAAERRKVMARVAAGEHPLGGGIALHVDAPREMDYAEAQASDHRGPRCGSCIYRANSGGYPKCHVPLVVRGIVTYPRDTGSENSDVEAWWPGCTLWEGRVK